MRLRYVKRGSALVALHEPEPGDLERLHLRWMIAEVATTPRLLFGAAGDTLRRAMDRALPLCGECYGAIGGACAGPDMPYRRARPEERCRAADHGGQL